MTTQLEIVDKRICKAPKPYSGKKEHWRHY